MLKGLSFALILQMMGVLAAYAAIFATARFGGPTAQGQFTTLKSFVDVANAVLLMGLPQAVVLVINRGLTNVGALAPWLRIYSVLAFVLALAAAAVFAGFLNFPAGAISWPVLALALAVWGFTSFSVTRGALLTRTDGLAFSLFTSMPQLVLLAGVLAVLAQQGIRFEWAYALQGIVCIAISHTVLQWLALKDAGAKAGLPPVRTLLSENLHAFVQAMLYSGQLFATVNLLRALGGTLDDVGQFGIISLPILALHAIAGIVAPLFYNRWSKLSEPEPPLKVARDIGVVALAAQAGALALLPFLHPLVLTVFGGRFEPSVAPLAYIAFAAFPAVMTRLLSPYLQTSHRAILNSASCLIRLAVSVAIMLAGVWLGLGLLISAALAWTLAEWLALAFIFWGVWRRFRS
jgi:O-antigen/teichoic acid export membrane protein